MSDESRSDSSADGLTFDNFCNFMRAGEYYGRNTSFIDLEVCPTI